MAKVTLGKKYLVIGSGNTLRGDDGLGPFIVEDLREAVKSYGDRIRIMAVPQLDVIFASRIAEAERIIFVDARADQSEDLIKTGRIAPAKSHLIRSHTSHSISMPGLLRIALDYYGAAPACYSVFPKGYDFSISETLSPKARIAAKEARDIILRILKPSMNSNDEKNLISLVH